MTILKKRTHRLATKMLEPVNTAAIIILGAYTTIWGLWVANPFWTVFTQAHLYDWMNRLMPEWAWGLIAIVVGLMMVYGVLRHSYRSLTLGALVGYFHWLAIAIMYFGGDWQNTGGITSLIIAIYSGFIWLNITRNKGNLKL
jgi:hypothetical protein